MPHHSELNHTQKIESSQPMKSSDITQNFYSSSSHNSESSNRRTEKGKNDKKTLRTQLPQLKTFLSTKKTKKTSPESMLFDRDKAQAIYTKTAKMTIGDEYRTAHQPLGEQIRTKNPEIERNWSTSAQRASSSPENTQPNAFSKHKDLPDLPDKDGSLVASPSEEIPSSPEKQQRNPNNK